MEILHFAVYDEITSLYGMPFQAYNNQDAMRIFHRAVQDPETNLNKHPQDYSLYFVAKYDNETGEYINIQPKQLLLKASQISTAIEVQP